MSDLHYLYTYEILAEQAHLEAHQVRQFRFELLKISLGWTLFSALVLSCGWGMNLQKVYDIGLIATTICVILSGVAFCANAIVYKHLNKKALDFEEKAKKERKDLEVYATDHKDTQLLKKLQEWDNHKC